jgi:hypothetical protein
LYSINKKVWWFDQEWKYYIVPKIYISQYPKNFYASSFHLTMIKNHKNKCIYLPFFYEKKRVRFYSPFLKNNSQSILDNFNY